MIEYLMEQLGDGPVLLLGGLAVGLLFGAAAQQSRFCLRAATVEFSQAQPGPRISVWLMVFFTALAAVQAASSFGLIAPEETRQIGAAGSMSGALVGGVLFGAGMVLARGCASRLLVLSATGNLRALLTGLVLTVVAQASLRGVLSTPRDFIGGLWVVPAGPSRDLAQAAAISPQQACLLGLCGMLAAAVLLRRNAVAWPALAAALLVGIAVAAGWVFTFAAAQVSFEPMVPGSITFTGPSADTLMALINAPVPPMSFSTGLVPGVFLGSGLSALWRHEFQLQGYSGGTSLLRYLAGALAMGFGAMLAGGCAVGAGVTGGALLATTAWVALASMWLGAVLAIIAERMVANQQNAALAR